MASKIGLDYQELASHFSVGDSVVPIVDRSSQTGRVVSLWPAIGMADVAFSMGVKRFPVEDLKKVYEDTSYLDHSVVPGGTGTVSVAGGPFPQENSSCPHCGCISCPCPCTNCPCGCNSTPVDPKSTGFKETVLVLKAANQRLASKHLLKTALYWTEKDRVYRATKAERSEKEYICPNKCGELKKTSFMKRDGKSEKLLACPKCLFLVLPDHIENHHSSGSEK